MVLTSCCLSFCCSVAHVSICCLLHKRVSQPVLLVTTSVFLPAKERDAGTNQSSTTWSTQTQDCICCWLSLVLASLLCWCCCDLSEMVFINTTKSWKVFRRERAAA
jgi:hypothetical protein